MRSRESRRALGAGFALAAAMQLFVFLFAEVRFSANDDQFLLRSFSWGGENGAPTFHLFFHAIYAYPLHWLNALFPAVPWVSVLEIGLMLLGETVLAKSVVQCFRKRFGTGVLFAACFTVLFTLYITARPTFTTVAATLGAAAAAQLASVDLETATDRQALRSMGFGLLLAALCYGFRQTAALPALFFCGIVFAYRFVCFVRRRGWKLFAAIAAAAVVVMGGLALERELEIDARGQREYLEWQQARSDVLDYLDLNAISDEARERVGWTDAQVTLLQNWYTMEECFSTEAFRYIADTQDGPLTRSSPGKAILDFRTRSPLIALSLVVLAAFCLCCALGLLLRRKGLKTFAALAATALGCLGLLAYLALGGRLPYRAVLTASLPAAATIFCLAPECLPDGKRFLPALCAVALAGTTVCAIPTLEEIRYEEPKWSYNTFAAMDEIAKANPDLLFLYSNELVNDLRVWPNTAEGLPVNLAFWGGWQRGSPEYSAKLAAFGLDGDHFTPEDWLRPELRFLSLKEEPFEALAEHLRQQLGENLSWERTKMDEALYAYRFYLESSD